jgi:hypothetical protein
MKTKQAGKLLEELADLAITAAHSFLSWPNTVDGAEDLFWDTLCDEHWTFPGAGPPSIDTERPRIEMFVCGYTLVWYESSKDEVRNRIRGALLNLLDYECAR